MKTRYILNPAAAIAALASNAVLAHPGHGAAERHFHAWGSEGLIVLGVVLVLLVIACFRR